MAAKNSVYVHVALINEIMNYLKSKDDDLASNLYRRMSEDYTRSFLTRAGENLSTRVKDKELLKLHDDLVKIFGYDQWFLSVDAVEEGAHSAYACSSLRMGQLLADMFKVGIAKKRSSGGGLTKWQLVSR